MTDNDEAKHGGARAGSGRKRQWYGSTVAMRIPEIWRNPLQHCMDSGITPIFESVQLELESVQLELESVQLELESVQLELESVQLELESVQSANERLGTDIDGWIKAYVELQAKNKSLQALLETVQTENECSLPDIGDEPDNELSIPELSEPMPRPKNRDELLQIALERLEGKDNITAIAQDFNDMNWTPSAYPGRTKTGLADSWNVKTLHQAVERYKAKIDRGDQPGA